MRRFVTLSLSILVWAALVLPIYAYYNPGTPTGYVSDFTGTLKAETISSLNTELTAYEQETQHEIAVVLIDSLEDDDISQFANQLFREWGIGKKAYDNGVLLLVAITDRKMRIEVGYGLEGALTDLESSWILDSTIKPYFKEGNYDEGITQGVEEIKRAIREEVVTASMDTYGDEHSDSIGFALSIGFFLLFFLIGSGGILAQSKSYWAGGVIGGVAGIIMSIGTGWIVSIPIAIILGLLFDYFASKYPPKGGSGSGWGSGGSSSWGGWSSGSGNSSSSSGGSFGGGSSGGGGASSGW